MDINLVPAEPHALRSHPIAIAGAVLWDGTGGDARLLDSILGDKTGERYL